MLEPVRPFTALFHFSLAVKNPSVYCQVDYLNGEFVENVGMLLLCLLSLCLLSLGFLLLYSLRMSDRNAVRRILSTQTLWERTNITRSTANNHTVSTTLSGYGFARDYDNFSNRL